tara:strand:- start:451 stop:702 length:252 start_codon:yes stop_codon:yes gene_type:complete
MRKNIIRKRKDTIVGEFVGYVYDFYGKDGIYDMGATVNQITTATIDYISDCLSKGEHKFCGDSLDRERVRDIMISKFNLKEVK